MATSSQPAQTSGSVDWQGGKTLVECNLHMLNTEDSCDVNFRCGSLGHVNKAHRYVLISRSCVFHAMFTGPLAEKSDVSVPEIEHQFFKQFILYLYTDNVTVDSDNATALLYAARKYAVTGLESKCLEFLEKNLIVGFLALSHDLVDQIVESDDLVADEHVIFTAVNSWSEAECGRQGREVTPEAKRSVLGETQMKVRFPLMKLLFLEKKVKASGLLTDLQRLMLHEYITSPDTDVKPFNTRQRLHINPIKSICRFNVKEAHWHYGSRVPDDISFHVNRYIILCGYQLYGAISGGNSSYEITTQWIDNDNLFSVIQVKTTYTATDDVIDVTFHPPIPVTAGQWYTLSVVIKGPDSWRGTQGMEEVVCKDGVEFSFRNDSQSANGTGVTRGQIPSLSYRLM